MVVQYFSNLLIKNKSNIISSLNSNEVSGPKSIYLVGYNFFRKMKFPSNWQISSTSFMTRVFPSILKTPKVSPVFKKDSKLDYSNYFPISPLLNIKKILEQLMYEKIVYLLQ